MEERLPPPFGRYIDRDTPLTFTFEGRPVPAYAGDTVASALVANGQWLMARSLKYHRPRGPFTFTGDDANALVQVGGEPNVPADRFAVHNGLAVRGQNYAGSLRNDRLRQLDRLSRFLPVGFYYRTFFRPRGAWRYWERVIRHSAGLGRIDVAAGAQGDRHDKAYLFADVAVIGAGPAGMSAALAAAEGGAEVMLVERDPAIGGALNYRRIDPEGREGPRQREALAAAVAASPSIRIMTGTTCTGWFADHMLTLIRRDRFYKLRVRRTIVATGAIGRPAVFRNNDLPGIVHGSAAQRLIHLYGVRPGRRAAVVTCNAHGHGLALDLLDAGCEVTLLEMSDETTSDPLRDRVRQRGVPIRRATRIVDAVERDNRIAALRASDGAAFTIECDLACFELGMTPAGSLIAHAGGDFVYSEDRHAMAIGALPDGMGAAGSVVGPCTVETAVTEGRAAGSAAADGAPVVLPSRRDDGTNHPWPIFPHPKGKDFVDFDEDLTVTDLRKTVADGFRSIELAKRYSTVGMGPSQGRLSALNTICLLAEATGMRGDGARVWTNRPPAAPETFGHLAGRAFQPVRRSPMHDRHLEAGAEMMVAGAWLRPAFYGRDRERAIREEVEVVRSAVGLIDVSTLGGIDIRGPDAGELLNRLYTFAYKKQEIGRVRYVVMCDEAGVLVDDGVACRLAEEHFYVTTTTGNSDAVHRAMLRWNAQWQLDVDITNVTAAYCGVNIAGPRARDVLARVATDIDLSPGGLPYLAVRTGEVSGIPARVFRTGFVGELSYEIHVPAGAGEALWDILVEAGQGHSQGHGIRPFGVEAQRVLRLEKGHIIVGQDTDGTTTPHEAALAWAIARTKPFFVGDRALAIRAKRPLSRILVGFVLSESADGCVAEGHLVIRDDTIVGHVTSVAPSPMLGRTIGLASVAPELNQPGGRLLIKAATGRLVEAAVTALPFYDPDNRRQEL